MTGFAGGAVERYGMTSAAGCSAMIYTPSAFICNAGVRPAVFGGPVVRVMTCGAIRSEHSSMICGVAMARNTGRA